MKSAVWHALFVCAVIAAPVRGAPLIQTATFQQGTDGYTGTFDRRITAAGTGEQNGADVNTETNGYFIDGGTSAVNDAGVQQGLIRFDDIVGGSGVPAGATVISATLDMTTGSTSNAQSGGAYNVYRLTTPFDSTATWAGTFGGNGLAGDVAEILGSFDDMNDPGSATSARVEKAVQLWVDGGSNLGFGIRSDRSTDGWSPHTTGAATVAVRPRLTVNYTLDPNVSIDSYQEGVNSYAGTTDIRLNGTGGSTVQGSDVQETFIDGYRLDPPSADQPYFLRYDDLDLSFNQTFKAELVMKGGFSSADADSGGPFTVHQVLEDWTTGLTYADLDSNADPTVNDANELIADGFIGAAAASTIGHADTEVIYIDVTSIVENWRNGQANYGFYIGTTQTTNGWQIFTSGANDPSFRPELRIIGVVPEPAAGMILVAGVIVVAGLARCRARRSA